MLALFGAGPDPVGMECAAIVKGYKKNQQLAKSRGGKHAKNSEDRVKELEPFYKRCTEAEAVEGIKRQGDDVQGVLDKIYQDGGSTGGVGPLTSSAGGRGLPVSGKQILTGAAVIGVGILALVYFSKRKKRGA